MRLKPYQKRLLKERDKLSKRLGKLVTFIESDEYKTLMEYEAYLLMTQSTIMASYVNILNTRIKMENIEEEENEN